MGVRRGCLALLRRCEAFSKGKARIALGKNQSHNQEKILDIDFYPGVLAISLVEAGREVAAAVVSDTIVKVFRRRAEDRAYLSVPYVTKFREDEVPSSATYKKFRLTQSIRPRVYSS